MSFSTIIGHDKEIGILKKAISNERIPHSFLFLGPTGIGKRLTALSLVKSLNCLSGTDDFCGVCQNCIDIESQSHPDVFIIEPREPESKGGGVDHTTGTIRIEAIRDIQQRLSYKSMKGGKKACIVDGAEKMNQGAQNAFLKTLEEPPADSVLILIASDNAGILPTIISRCQRINFSPLSRDALIRIIRERLDIDEEKAALFSSLSGGSIGKVLGWNAETILEQREKIVDIASRLSKRDTEGLFQIAERISKGDDPVESLEFLKLWYRDIAVYQEGREDMVINSDLLPFLQQYGRTQVFQHTARAFSLIHRAQLDIMPPRYANKQLTIENLFMQLAG